MEIRVRSEVATALADGRPAVALESTLIAHGLPRPDNLAVAERVEGAARGEGAVPATVAVLDGVAHVGLDHDQLVRVAGDAGVVKLSERDLPVAAAKRLDGATTVAATALLAHRGGVDVFATGGLGGVHRGASQTWDVSADLVTLARTPIVLVCAGVKSILDVPATLERLESLGVTVVGYRSDRFAGFYRSDSGQPVPWTADDVGEIAAIHRARAGLGLRSALVVANPLPEAEQLEPGLHDHALASGLEAAQARGVGGRALTPFLLAHFHEVTGGRSLDVNIRLVLRNVTLAAQIAAALMATV
jgi:pseudouridine-5'-phosphate glycosidase